MSGEPSIPEAAAPAASGADAVSVSELAAMKANIDQLQREVAELRETVARLGKELGISA
jgi:hypothetical protein